MGWWPSSPSIVDTGAPVSNVLATVGDALNLSLVPAVVMLITSLLALSITVHTQVVSALQHLAAGIVLSAVAVELVPEILAAPNDLVTTLGMTTGFASGIGFFLFLAKACGGEEGKEEEEAGEEEDDDDDEQPEVSAAAARSGPKATMESFATRFRAHSDPIHTAIDFATCDATLRHSAGDPGAASGSFKRSTPTKMDLVSKQELMRVNAARCALRNAPPPPFPFVLTVAVCTDALVDGLLIGISSASGAQAGIVITGALSIEMGFLGLTFATTLRKQPTFVRAIAVLLPPLLLICGGASGGVVTSLVANTPALHTGLLAFGVSALLYLVTEELLLEAHAAQHEEHIWWVDACFFVGFYLSFLLEKYSRSLE